MKNIYLCELESICLSNEYSENKLLEKTSISCQKLISEAWGLP